MASDQIEYCGVCEHYAHCIDLAHKGQLHMCIAANNDKEEK